MPTCVYLRNRGTHTVKEDFDAVHKILQDNDVKTPIFTDNETGKRVMIPRSQISAVAEL